MTDRTVFRVAELTQRSATAFAIEPDADARAAMAARLGLMDLRKLRLTGEIRPLGASDWLLVGHLGATVVQPCAVTLEPVKTRIEADVERRYLAEWREPEGDEVEMPEDEAAEPLGAVIDAGAVLEEALALNLPLYPRREGVELGEAVFTEPGKAPLTDQSARPFAGLAELRDRLSRKP